jgi:predicted GNAT family acetyltransferase
VNVLRDNAAAGRLEMDEEGRTVFADYRLDGTRLIIDHVEAPPSLRGTGAAGRFMTALARFARSRGLAIVPLCGYAARWLRGSAEYRDLVVPREKP